MGAKLVEGLEGSPLAIQKAKIILQTLSGERTVKDACEELGIVESMFYKLRDRTLKELVESLEPRPVGRPPQSPQESPELTELREKIAQLEAELKLAKLRAELAELQGKKIWRPYERKPKRRPK